MARRLLYFMDVMISKIRTPSIVVAIVWISVLTVTGLGAQPGESPPFREEQKITAIDVMVQVVSRGGEKDPIGALPAYLAPEDFEVVAAGAARPVIGVSAFGPAQHAADREPWSFVLYFDRSLASPHEAGWAAAELVARVERLTDLGAVEVVVADPEPQSILAPTRDAELLGSVLAEIALFPEGDDHDVLELRDEFLAEIGKTGSEIDPVELAGYAIEEERRIVRRQLDGLLTWLAGAETGAGRTGARRALFLVSAGFDLEPESFYRPALARQGKSLPRPAAAVDLAADVEDLGRALAAYGWLAFPLLPPPDEPPPTGLRIGKWRVGKPQGEVKETPIDPLNPHDKVTPVLLNFLRLKREGNQDREKAESYFEFGGELASRGELVEAEQALRMALLHFADNPKWADRRAATLAKLGEVLEQQGRRREAREAFQQAQELAPESTLAAVGPLAVLEDPVTPIDRLAGATTGKLLRSGEALDGVLSGLPYRVRVSFQLADVPEGTLHPIEVRCKRRGCQLAVPAWARNGTPDPLAAARLRRWLADDQYEGALDVEARLVPASGGYALEGRIEVPETAGGEAGELRLTLGFGDPEAIGAVRHVRLEALREAGGRRWSFHTGVDADELPAVGPRGVAVIAELLESGAWGGTVVGLPEDESR